MEGQIVIFEFFLVMGLWSCECWVGVVQNINDSSVFSKSFLVVCGYVYDIFVVLLVLGIVCCVFFIYCGYYVCVCVVWYCVCVFLEWMCVVLGVFCGQVVLLGVGFDLLYFCFKSVGCLVGVVVWEVDFFDVVWCKVERI